MPWSVNICIYTFCIFCVLCCTAVQGWISMASTAPRCHKRNYNPQGFDKLIEHPFPLTIESSQRKQKAYTISESFYTFGQENWEKLKCYYLYVNIIISCIIIIIVIIIVVINIGIIIFILSIIFYFNRKSMHLALFFFF